MKVYAKSGNYMWEFDRFLFFTESEKSSLLEGLKDQRKRWSTIEEVDVKGGMVEMLDNLIEELK